MILNGGDIAPRGRFEKVRYNIFTYETDERMYISRGGGAFLKKFVELGGG